MHNRIIHDIVSVAGVPWLFDLVSVSDPKLRLAFWYALRNTLVAGDLDQASRIAYGCKDKRFSRVVTVAGQLIAGARMCKRSGMFACVLR
jgi:structural maintenance of chromosome 4